MINKTKYIYPLIPIILTLWIILPFIKGPYTFFLDLIFGPAWNSFQDHFFGLLSLSYSGSLPLYSLLSFTTSLFGAPITQKILLFTILLLCAIIPYSLIPGSKYAKLYASFLFLLNPFVYSRFLVGHWIVIWGLALLPLVLYSFTTYLEKGDNKNLIFTILALTLLGFSAHLLFTSGILLLSLVFFKYLETKDLLFVKRAILPLILFIPLNAYWLGPVLFSRSTGISSISILNIQPYAPQTNIFSALYSIASMHGFWREGITYARNILPFTEYLFIFILFLAVHGFITNYKDPKIGYIVKALGVTAIIALILGAGASGPGASLFEWMFENIPLFKGMRDSQKFVALLVLVYAYLGALGVQDFVKDLRSTDRTRYIRWKYVYTGVVILAVAAPFIYTFPMLTGFDAQVTPADYPGEWYEVREFLELNARDSQVLFLPWHLYMDYSWVPNKDKRISNPATVFFSEAVIRGGNVEIGWIYSQSDTPVSNYIEYLFGLGWHKQKNITNLGELLIPLNVKYILVTKEGYWEYYTNILQEQGDLALVLENDYFNVYENKQNVSRSYSVDKVVYVSGLDDYLNRSETEDIAQAVYVIDEKRAGKILEFGDEKEGLLKTDMVHPAKYCVEGIKGDLTVFTQQQDTSYSYWTMNGNMSEYQMLGFIPVFESGSVHIPEDSEVILKYERFYRLYLPSYIVSLFTFIVLVVMFIRRRDGFL